MNDLEFENSIEFWTLYHEERKKFLRANYDASEPWGPSFDYAKSSSDPNIVQFETCKEAQEFMNKPTNNFTAESGWRPVWLSKKEKAVLKFGKLPIK